MSTRESYRKGPVVLRGTQIPTQTTDARLLSSTADADWLHSDPWRSCGSRPSSSRASAP